MSRFPTAFILLPLLLGSCRNGPDIGQLETTARIFLRNDGAILFDTPARPYRRPCLDGLSFSNTSLGLGGPFGDSSDLVAFVEKHQLAKVTHERQPGGWDRVSLTPVAPYDANWQDGQAGLKHFCFGKIELIEAEAVADAKPITAGANEAYIIQGTEAVATRMTFKLTDLPGGDFVADLKERPSLLVRGAMQPNDYDQEITVVAALPLKPENFIPGIDQTK